MKAHITLGDMQRRGLTMLEIACRHCSRNARLSIARLIAEHGPDDHGHLGELIASDCPKKIVPRLRPSKTRSSIQAADIRLR